MTWKVDFYTEKNVQIDPIVYKSTQNFEQGAKKMRYNYSRQ